MRETLTISALAKRSRVPSKTLRYWESLGLLPKAQRSHAGYRVFDSESLRYISFIVKSKAIGLTLAEMREILRLARTGHCPCPEVVHWTHAKEKAIAEQIQSLSTLLRRLKRIRREWSRGSCSRGKCGEVCYLVEELPECKSSEGEKQNAKNLAHSNCCHGNACCDRVAGNRGSRKLLPARLLPALSLQVKQQRSKQMRIRAKQARSESA
ncbi:MAG TPA: MerR family DNA-binding transcriptional regulator [Candidatus Acidoferrales bacterium]|nr:MerR family DNA-binding transcriptional regulator [Candidatus Acidoferrales bacterium]